MKKDDYIRIRVPSKLKIELKQKAVEADMEFTEYIISCTDTNPVIVLQEGKEIAAIFYELKNALLQNKQTVYCNNHDIVERGDEACRLLNSLMLRIAELDH